MPNVALIILKASVGINNLVNQCEVVYNICMKKNTITKDDILHVAKLSRLQLTEEEIGKYKKQLEETINFIKNLEELDTRNIQATNSVVNLKNVTFQDGTTNKKALTQNEALSNTKKSKDGKFVVDRIM